MSMHTKSLIVAALFSVVPIVGSTQGLISHEEMEEQMARFGQSPRDLGAEVVKMCRITRVPNQEPQSDNSQPLLPGSSLYEPCPDDVLRIRQQQVSENNIKEPSFEWDVEIAYQWIPQLPITTSSRLVRDALVRDGVAVTIDGQTYLLANDRKTLMAFDQCEWVSVPGTNHIARKAGCPPEQSSTADLEPPAFEAYRALIGGGMQITIRTEAQDVAFRNCDTGLPVQATDGSVTYRSHQSCRK